MKKESQKKEVKQKILKKLILKIRIPMANNGTKLLEMIQKPIDDIEIDAFIKLIESDPALLASVLQLANSPFYKGVEKSINLKDAIIRIGLEEVINSVCLSFFQKVAPKIPNIQGFTLKNYWLYSWACAISVKKIRTLKICSQIKITPSELYMIGMLQGIGKISMAINYPEDFEKCILISSKNRIPLYQLEKKMFGASSAVISAKIMETWNFPELLWVPIFYMNNPQDAPLQYQESASLIQFVNYIVLLSNIGTNGDHGIIQVEDLYLCGKQSCIPAFQKEKNRKILTKKIIQMLDKRKNFI